MAIFYTKVLYSLQALKEQDSDANSYGWQFLSVPSPSYALCFIVQAEGKKQDKSQQKINLQLQLQCLNQWLLKIVSNVTSCMFAISCSDSTNFVEWGISRLCKWFRLQITISQFWDCSRTKFRNVHKIYHIT